MATVKFTKNFKDRSSDSGFQFEFFCDRAGSAWMPGWLAYHFPENCSYSYVSSLQQYPVGVANKVKEATSWLTAHFPQIKGAGEALNTIHKEAWDSAFNSAVQEAKRHFRHCKTCDKWVCAHSCFSQATDTCRSCSGLPPVKAGNGTQPGMQTCQHCGAATEEGRFCSTCGKPTAMEVFCGNCGKHIESDHRYKFCPHCGDSLSYLDDIFKQGKESA